MTRMPSFPPGENAPPDPPASSPGGETEHATELAVATPGLADVVAKRIEQILRYGHTPEADAQRPVRFFALECHAAAGAVLEDSTFALKRTLMRRHAVKLAALALALIDRIDADAGEQTLPNQPEGEPRG